MPLPPPAYGATYTGQWNPGIITNGNPGAEHVAIRPIIDVKIEYNPGDTVMKVSYKVVTSVRLPNYDSGGYFFDGFGLSMPPQPVNLLNGAYIYDGTRRKESVSNAAADFNAWAGKRLVYYAVQLNTNTVLDWRHGGNLSDGKWHEYEYDIKGAAPGSSPVLLYYGNRGHHNRSCVSLYQTLTAASLGMSIKVAPKVTLSSNDGGNLSHTGEHYYTYNTDSDTYSWTPADGYYVKDVKVDGVSQGSILSYKFSNVTADHTVAVEFARIPASVSYDKNCPSATGETSDTNGLLYDTVSASECSFEDELYEFDSWNTSPDGTGETYRPGDSMYLASESATLYAQWVPKVRSASKSASWIPGLPNSVMLSISLHGADYESGKMSNLRISDTLSENVEPLFSPTEPFAAGDGLVPVSVRIEHAPGSEGESEAEGNVLDASKLSVSYGAASRRVSVSYTGELGDGDIFVVGIPVRLTESAISAFLSGGSLPDIGESGTGIISENKPGYATNGGGAGDSVTVSDVSGTDSHPFLLPTPAVEPVVSRLVYDADAPEGEVEGSMGVQIAPAGGQVPVLECSYMRPGYTFSGWSPISDDEWAYLVGTGNRPMVSPGSNLALSIDGSDTVLYAVWEKNPTVSVRVSGHGIASLLLLEDDASESSLGEAREGNPLSCELVPGDSVKVSWVPNDAWWAEKVVIDGEEIALRNEDESGLLEHITEHLFEDMHADHDIEIVFSPMVEMPETGSLALFLASFIGISFMFASIVLIACRCCRPRD